MSDQQPTVMVVIVSSNNTFNWYYDLVGIRVEARKCPLGYKTVDKANLKFNDRFIEKSDCVEVQQS